MVKRRELNWIGHILQRPAGNLAKQSIDDDDWDKNT